MQLFGIIQLLLGLVCAAISCASIQVDRINLGILAGMNETANQTIGAYAMIGLDGGALMSSIWVIVVGFVPACLVCGSSYRLVRSKVIFMVFNIMAASLFVPIMFAQAVVTHILRGSHEQLSQAMAAIAAIEFFIAIAASVYCCKSPWRECVMKKKCIEKADDIVDEKKKELETCLVIDASKPDPYSPEPDN